MSLSRWLLKFKIYQLLFRYWGVGQAGTTSPSLNQHLNPNNKGPPKGLEGLQESLRMLLSQKESHREVVVLKGLMELVVCHGLFIMGSCWVRKGAITKGKQIFIMGWGVRVTNGIRGQGKNIVRNYLTMWTSVGVIRHPTGGEWSSRGSLGVGGVIWPCPCSYSSALVVFRSCLLIVRFCHWFWRDTMGIGPSSPSLETPNLLSNVSALPHGIPTTCLWVLTHPYGASSKFGKVFLALSLSLNSPDCLY